MQNDLAWLAGIVDGEGCFSVKRAIRRKSGARKGSWTSYQLWLVVCNTSRPMVERIEQILEANGVKHQPTRKVWKGKKATRWQFWIHVAAKHELLRVTELLLPHLTAKRDEAEIVVWFLKRACQVKSYRASPLEKTILDSMSLIKRNGGEAPAEIRAMLREVIPSQATTGSRPAVDGVVEGVETTRVSPSNTPSQELPARRSVH